jgi:hypothetical protein
VAGTDLLAWVRAGMGEGDDPAGAVARVRLLLDAVQARPEWLPRWHAWWQLFKDTVDPAPLLADFGFAPRTAFLSDAGRPAAPQAAARHARHLRPDHAVRPAAARSPRHAVAQGPGR